MNRYEWKEGTRIKLDPQMVGEHLTKLGRITAESVLDDAKNPDSPLHPFFEWDDSTAAEEYRRVQARLLIRSVVVKIERPKEAEPLKVRAFSHVGRGEASQYVSTAHALSDDAIRAQILSDAINELQAFRRKYSDLQELAGVVRAIDSLTLDIRAVAA